MTKGQAERLFPLIEEVLAESGVALRDLDALAVGTGPGNFTGLRIAVSAVRGLALSLGRPALGIPNHEALADGLPRPLLVSLDARRGKIYLQRFGDRPRGPEIAFADALDEECAVPGLHVCGAFADEIAVRLDAIAVEAPLPAPAIARIAARRVRDAPQGATWSRPAPLYLRPADAAPSTSTAPPILS